MAVKPKIGDHVYHDVTGDYLGRVTKVTDNAVQLGMPRTRDGYPVTFATRAEIEVGPLPNISQ